MKAINKVDACEPCIIHFRYATRGSIRRANCHPFRYGNVSFAHNGHMYIETRGDKTDSETFLKKHVLSAIDAFGYDSPDFYDFMRSHSGYSRFALMNGDKIRIFGTFADMDGCQFSNLRFMYPYSFL